MARLTLKSTQKLLSGFEIPVLGYGVRLLQLITNPTDDSGLPNVRPRSLHLLTRLIKPAQQPSPKASPSKPSSSATDMYKPLLYNSNKQKETDVQRSTRQPHTRTKKK